jgi:NADH dehydrogenase
LDEVGYRAHARQWRYRFFYGVLNGIDRANKRVLIAPIIDEDGRELMDAHAIRYDYLVLAVGAVTNNYGVAGVAENCLYLDSRLDADRFRQRLLDQCLRVSRRAAIDPADRSEVHTAIVGGGATGVELAAELMNAADGLRHYGLEVFDGSRFKVTLIEQGPRILGALGEDLAKAAHAELEAKGVRVMTGGGVREVRPDGVACASGELVSAQLIVWAAGVRGAPVLADLDGLEINSRTQIVVRPTLQTTLDDDIYALGDCCACSDAVTGKAVPPRAQAAQQMADLVVNNILARLKAKPQRGFVYTDHGSLVALGRFATLGNLMGNLFGGRMAIEGRVARFVYVSLYQRHLLAIHGWMKGLAMILVGHAHRVIRPRLKLH